MKRVLLFFLLPGFSSELFSQDIHFTQLSNVAMYINPAFTGVNNLTFQSDFRIQWPKFDNPVYASYNGISTYVSRTNGFVGFHYLYEREGAVSQNRYNGVYAQNIKIGKYFLMRPAIEVSYFVKELDWSKIKFPDQLDPRFGFMYSSSDIPRGGIVSNIDFSAGILNYYRKIVLGFSVHHITQPNQSFMIGNSPLPMKLSAQLGYRYRFLISRGADVDVMPYVYFAKQSNFQDLLIGLTLLSDKGFLFGGSWRRKDAVNFYVGFKTKKWMFRYSYDYTTSIWKDYTGGSHEFSLMLNFLEHKTNKKFIKPEFIF